MNSPSHPSAIASAVHTLLFIDAAVADAGALLEGLPPGVRAVMLDGGRDGVLQIAEALAGYSGLASIQLVSHGAAGQLQLGTARLDAGTLAGYADALRDWGGALRPGGDLLLYGCSAAQGASGMALVDGLADATGADVAASTDLTGFGGDWLLERSSGAIEASSAISYAAQQDYAYSLGLVNGGVAGTINWGTSSVTSLVAGALNGILGGQVISVLNNLNTGFDVVAKSSTGGGLTISNVGSILNTNAFVNVAGVLSAPEYVELRANSGVFDLTSLKLGSADLAWLLSGTFTVQALDAGYAPRGAPVTLTGVSIGAFGTLSVAGNSDFAGIGGVRISASVGAQIAIDDVVVSAPRVGASISTAAYNAGSGVLTVTAVGINAGDAIDPSKLTFTGEGGSYTLTSPVVSAASGTLFSITLNAADKLALNGLLNNNGLLSVGGTAFNLAAAVNWDTNTGGGLDLTANAVLVTNVQLPVITSASYNAATHVLTVTGNNLVGVVGAANDINVAKLVLTGQGGVSRTLTSSSNVEVTSATSFSVTLSGADVAAVAALVTKDGSASAGGTPYTLAVGDDWNSVIGNTSIAVGGVGVTVSNTANSAPVITGAGPVAVADNGTVQPFAAVTVADANGGSVSMTISYNAANGTLSGAGLGGTPGSYTLSAASPAALTTALKALVFTPTANQAAVGVGVATAFTLTATDSAGLAGAASSAAVVTATSVNDAPLLGGTAAGQGLAAGATIQPFSSVTLSDPDVGAAVIVTITPDSAAKGMFTAASLSASGFSTSDGGATYTHAAVAPGAAQAALQALVFQSTAGMNATTTFTVSINDGSTITSNSATTVIAGTPSGTTVATVAFSADSGISATDLITNVAAQTISGTLSGGLAAGERVEVSLNNGATWTTATAAQGSSSWSLAGQTLSGSDTLQVRVANIGGGGTPLSRAYTLDTTAPAAVSAGVAFSADSGASGTDLITNVAAQTVSGTLSANLAAGERVEVSFNNGGSWSTASAAAGSNTWTLAGQTLNGSGTLQVRVADAAGNLGSAVGAAYALDTAGPTASMSANVSVLKSGESATVTIVFSEPPAGFTLADLGAVGGTVSDLAVTADPRVYTVQFTPNAGLSGLLGGVSLTAGSYTDAAGNSGAGAASAAISITTLGPSVTIASDKAALKSGETAAISFTFSTLPFGFSAADVSVAGGTLSGLAPTLDPLVWSAVFTPAAGTAAGNASITVTGGSYTDLLGNQGGAGASPAIAIDTLAPTLAISSDKALLGSGQTATISFTFSEAPANFAAGDVSVSGGTLSGLAASPNPLVWTATFTPTPGTAAGSAVITVAGGSYTDLAGNSGQAAPSPSVSIDTLAPTTMAQSVAFSADTGASGADLITRTAAQTVSGTLNGALAAGEQVQVSLDNGATWSNASGASGSASWSLAGVTLGASNTLQVRVNDAAGNHGPAFSAPYVLDTTAPTLAVSSNLATLKAGETAQLTFTFSEAPAGFNAGDLTVSGGTVSGLAATGNPLVYTAVFTPTPGQTGASASVTVAGGSYTDTAGNAGGSGSVAIGANTAPPTLAISSSAAALKAGETATISFTFSQPPTGFDAADVSVANGALSGFAATSNPLVFTAVFTPTAGLAGGNAAITVAAGSYTDAAGNPGGAGSAAAIAIDTLAPTVTIGSSAAALKAGETATITFTFSEAPSGFVAGDVSVAGGGALSGFAATANPLVYTALYTPAAGVENVAAVISVGAGSYLDLAGNSGAGASAAAIAVDTLAPSAVGNGVSFSVDNGSSSTDLVTNSAAQTISGTLAGALGAGETVEVSLDNGATWSAAASAGNTWTLAGQTLAASNTLQVRVSDAAGNHGTPFAAAYVLDTSAPGATVSSSATALKAGETATLTFTFTEAPVGFTAADVGVTGGTLSGFAATANPLVYTALFTPTAGVDGGSAAVTVTAGGYTDSAGNAGQAAALPALAYDTLAPATTGASAAFSADSGASGNDLVTNVAAQTVSGTLSANLAAGETVEVSLNNGVSWSAAAASVGANGWSLAGQTLSGSGTLQVRVNDAAGNHGAAYSAAYVFDQAAPTLQIASDKATLNSAETATLTFTFSEAPAGFAAGDVGVSGGTLSGFAASANPLVYTAVFTPTPGVASGTASVTVAAGSYTDAAGNAGQAGAVAPISYGTVAPGVAITSDVAALKAGQTALISFKFSSAPTGFTGSDISASGGTLGALTATADPLLYTAVFTPAAGVAAGTANVGIAAGLYQDGVGNAGAAASMVPLPVDTLAPTLAISSSAASLNSGASATVTFTFSEAPAVFSVGDVSVANGALSNLVQTADPRVYTATLTPAANVAGGSVNVSVAAGAYADAAGNAGAGGTAPPIAIDTLAPSQAATGVLFSADTGSSSTDLITRTAAQNIAGTLSGPLTAGDVVEVSLDNGATWLAASGSVGGSSWLLAGRTLAGSNTLQVRVSDAAGNHGAAGSYAYVLDTAAPTVALSSDAAALKAGQTATVTFTFSEAPVGFALGDLVASGGTLSGFTATADPRVYTVLLTPTAGYSGGASVTLGAGLYADAAGNSGAGASTAAIGVDTQAPTLAIASSASALKAGETATITFTFSEAPSGFTLADVSASNGTLGALTAGADPRVYTAVFTPDANSAAASAAISVAGGAYTDAAGNAGGGASAPAIAVDTLAPATAGTGVAFSADNGPSATDLVTNVAQQTLSGTLGAPLAAGDQVTVSFDNGATWVAAAGAVGASAWTLANQTLSGSGTLLVRVDDAAGNHGPSFSAAYVLDQLAPTMTVSSSASMLKAGESATLTFTFSEAPSGFVVGDLAAQNGTLSGFTVTADPRVYTVLLTPTANLGGASAGVTLAAGAYTDTAGNAGAAAASPLVSVDTQAPSLLITSSSNALKIGESATLTFTFNEAPVGFAAGDVSVSGGTLSGFGLTADPRVYTALLTPTQGVAGGSASIAVAGGSYADAAGNAGGAATGPAIAYSTAAPTTGNAGVVFSNDTGVSNSDLVTSDALQVISGTLNANLAAGETVEVSLDNGASWIVATTAVGSNGWALPQQVLGGSGTLQVRVGDAAGNYGSAASAAYVLDMGAPSAAIASNAVTLRDGQAATLSFTFSEAPQGFVEADLVVTGGTLSGFGPTANPLVYSATFTPTPGFNGSAGVSLAAGLYTDRAGNVGGGAAGPAISVDAQAPTLAIASSATTLKAGETATITFTFSEAPLGFAAGDVSVSGGTLSGFTVSANPLVYTAVFTPTAGLAGGNASIAVPASVYSDAAGNGGLAGSAPAIAIDTLAPLAGAGNVLFSSDTGASATDLVTSVAAQTVSGTLSAPLAGGETVQVSFDGGATWQSASVVGNDWSINHTLTGSGALHVRVEDAAGNYGAELVRQYAFDTTAPTVAVSSNPPVLNGAAPATISFTFSEAPAGFSAADVSVSGGTLGAITATANPLVFTAQFTPTAGQPAGSASITLNGAYSDAAGNAGAAGGSGPLPVDTVAPTVTAGGAALSADSGVAGDLVTNVAAQTISGTLSGVLDPGDVVQVSLDNGTSWSAASVVGAAWTLAGQTLTASGTLQVRVSDAAGNSSTAYTAAYVLDTTAPTVAVTAPAASLAPGQSMPITFTLSDPGVLTLGDVVVSGGTLSNFSGSGSSYTALLTPTPNSMAPVSIGVNGMVFADLAGNASVAATPLVLPIVVPGAPPAPPGTPSMVDGVEVRSSTGTDPRSGMPTQTIVVPVIVSSRAEDSNTAHATLADIPLGVGSGAQATGLMLSLPVGAGAQASTMAQLLTPAQAMSDLIGRIDDNGAAGTPGREAMQSQAKAFLDGMAPGQGIQAATLTLSAPGAAAGASVLVGAGAGAGGGGGSAVALAIDARALPAGVDIVLDRVDFAAIIGAATVHGGGGKNFVIGDDAAQRIVLTVGSDDDTLYGNGGKDVLGTAGGRDVIDGGGDDDIVFGGGNDDTLAGGAGNDVLQGGRSDSGQWQFYLNSAGQVIGRHQMALTDPGLTEQVTAAELNHEVAMLGFSDGTAAQLQALSLLYHAAFQRAPDLAGLSFWVDSGLSMAQIAAGFLRAPEAVGGLNQLGNQAFVQQLVQNSVGRAATAAELADWSGRLDAAPGDAGARASVLQEIALRAEHRTGWVTADGVALGGAMLEREQGWFAGSGDDRLEGGAGSDWLIGGDGIDTIVYSGVAGSYGLSLSRAGDVMVSEPGGALDTLRQIEFGEFAGQKIDLGFTQADSTVLQNIGMLYHLTLDRAGDFNGFRHWLDSKLQGAGLADGFVFSAEFQQRYGALSDDVFVRTMLQNALHEQADAATLQRWDAYLAGHTRSELLSAMAADAVLIGSQQGPQGLTLIGGL